MSNHIYYIYDIIVHIYITEKGKYVLFHRVHKSLVKSFLIMAYTCRLISISMSTNLLLYFNKCGRTTFQMKNQLLNFINWHSTQILYNIHRESNYH